MNDSTLCIFICIATAITLFASLGACADDAARQCQRSDDCPGDQMCRLATCVTPERDAYAAQSTSEEQTATAPAEQPDTGPVRCDSGRSPKQGELAINEVLANVPSGPEGDASGDGERDAYGDEFIEFVNRSGVKLDLYDVTVSVDGTEKHAFAGRCLPAGHGMVLFGGVPMADSGDDVQVVGIDGLGLSNSGGAISVRNPDDAVIATYDWEETRAQSHTLSPQINGSTHEWHTELSDNDALFSPGLCADGTPLSAGCTD